MGFRLSPGCCCGGCCTDECVPASSHHTEYEFTFSAMECEGFTGTFHNRKKVYFDYEDQFPDDRLSTQWLNCDPGSAEFAGGSPDNIVASHETMGPIGGCRNTMTPSLSDSSNVQDPSTYVYTDENWPYYANNPCKAMSGDFIVTGCANDQSSEYIPSPSSDDFDYDAPANAVSYCFWNFESKHYNPSYAFNEDGSHTGSINPQSYVGAIAGYLLDNPDTSQIRIEDTFCSLRFDYSFYGFDLYKFKISNGGSISYEWRLYVRFNCMLSCCCAGGIGTNTNRSSQIMDLKRKIVTLSPTQMTPLVTPYTNSDWYWSYVPSDGTCSLDGTESWTETRPTLDLSVSCAGFTHASMSPFRPSVAYTVSDTLDDWGYLCENMGIGEYTLTAKPKGRTS